MPVGDVGDVGDVEPGRVVVVLAPAAPPAFAPAAPVPATSVPDGTPVCVRGGVVVVSLLPQPRARPKAAPIHTVLSIASLLKPHMRYAPSGWEKRPALCRNSLF
jgi:hypothetical protein